MANDIDMDQLVEKVLEDEAFFETPPAAVSLSPAARHRCRWIRSANCFRG